jgi:polysaccharide export outer membrane protein
VALQLRFVVLILAIGLAACAKTPDPKTATAALTGGDGSPVAVGAVSLPNVGAAGPVGAVGPVAAVASPGAGDDYRIAPLDVLEISVFQVPDLGGTVQVSASGDIDMPLIGAVPASGKTLSELKAELTKDLGDKYLQAPDVSVSIKDAMSQRITVEGAVNKPGVYPTSGPTTLMQVVALAGGLAEIADPNGVVVFRDVGGKRKAAVFNYKAIRAGKADDPVIAGGDVVAVDESGLKSALRNVRASLPIFGMFAPLL